MGSGGAHRKGNYGGRGSVCGREIKTRAAGKARASGERGARGSCEFRSTNVFV